MTLTLEQFLATMPTLQKPRWRALADSMLPHMNAAMQEAEINTPLRVAAFLAQLGHESMDLTRWVEMAHVPVVAGCAHCASYGSHAAGAQYEGRRSLGNTARGDGVRFKGRGPIQLTGRSNYRAAGKALGEPLETRPALAEEMDVGFRVAAWYWTTRDLNALADKGDIDAVSRKVNGGDNGLEDRRKRYVRALEILQK